jgi:DNA-binding response OmpR family regulator
MRLLIVKDNAELSRLVAGGLLAAGYESDIVGSRSTCMKSSRSSVGPRSLVSPGTSYRRLSKR